MRVEAVELVVVELPLVAPFGSAHGTTTVRRALLVRARTDTGDGWGECVAPEAPGYSDEYLAGAHLVLRDHLVPRLLAAGQLDADRGAELLGAVPGHRMAKAALEVALLDAELRCAGVSLASHIGAVRTRVPAGVAVGLHDDPAAAARAAAAYVDAGYRRVKLKIAPGRDLALVAAVRSQVGPGVQLQADANGGYAIGDAPHLARLDEHELVCLEQPLPSGDLLGHAELARRLATPICLDEPLVDADATRLALDTGACRVVNLKPGRVGGVREARRVHDLCLARGAPLWCGGMLETGIGRAVNVAVAALPGCTLPGDVSASDRYFAHDIAGPFVLDDGYLAVPDGPGLGVEIDRAALDAATVAVEEVRA
jgi:O-succinylbenzoate synthase